MAESPTPAQTAKVLVTRLSLPGFARCDGRHRMVDCIRVASSGAAPTRRVLTMPDRSKESVSEHYRRLAQECLEMVPTIEDEDSRASLIEMARVWIRLATSYEDDTSMPPAATKETRPAIQQQEQAQPKNDDDKV